MCPLDFVSSFPEPPDERFGWVRKVRDELRSAVKMRGARKVRPFRVDDVWKAFPGTLLCPVLRGVFCGNVL